jgi:hypothetical protein
LSERVGNPMKLRHWWAATGMPLPFSTAWSGGYCSSCSVLNNPSRNFD